MMPEYLSVILVVFYAAFLFWCLDHWNNIQKNSDTGSLRSIPTVTIVVALRNEEENVSGLLNSLLAQDYPREKLRVILVDDHSTDNTFQLAQEFIVKNAAFNFSCIHAKREFKKGALTDGIETADSEIIVTTDADARAGKEWIQMIANAFLAIDVKFVSGPVDIAGKGITDKLQSAEMAGLVGIGAAGIQSGHPMICNGANLAFRRNAFLEVGGYSGSQRQSGDDTQLMLKIRERYPDGLTFIKDYRAIVRTVAVDRLDLLWSQRKRWASKIPSTLSGFTIFISCLAWLVHVVVFIQLLQLFYRDNILVLILPLLIKVIAELIFVRKVMRFYKRDIDFWLMLFAQPLYCLYIIAAGIFVPFGTYEWKGRRQR